MSQELLKDLLAIASLPQYILPLRDIIFRKKDQQGNSLKWYKRITRLGYFLLTTGIATSILSYEAGKEDKKPLLNVLEGPKFLNGVGDSIPIVLSIKNYGKGNARNIDSKVVGIRQIGRLLLREKVIKMKTDNSSFLTGEGEYTYVVGYKITSLDSVSVSFMYFRTSYTDEESESQKDTIREIYRLPFPKNGNLIFDAHGDDFDKVEELLRKDNEW